MPLKVDRSGQVRDQRGGFVGGRSKQVQQIAKQLKRTLAHATAEFILEVTANLIETTPVDTGWARANWIPSLGTPFTQTVGSPSSVDTSAQQAGMLALLAYEPATLASPLKVFVSNNVPYIGRLNYGWSSQAPSGFVRFAVDKAAETIRMRYTTRGTRRKR